MIKFPPESTFCRLDMHTTGSVYANVQNKHSAPGICTLSGDSLFKLFRATGDRRYLELLKEIAHNLPQYLSREDRPITAWNNDIGVGDGSWREMPTGWMCERVNMSDWLEPVGEIFYGSCWCEVSNMLTYAEVTGIYVQPNTGFICVIDHVDAKIISTPEGAVKLEIRNLTQKRAEVKAFIENSNQIDEIIGLEWTLKCMRLVVKPGCVELFDCKI